MDPKGKVIPLQRAGQLATCDRCGAPCKVSQTTNTAAKMLKHAETPVGNCINCAVAEWFVLTGLRETTAPQALLSPVAQKQFEAIMKLSKADGTPAEINWQHVVANWSLPFVTRRGKGRKAKAETFPEFDPGLFDDRISRARGPLPH